VKDYTVKKGDTVWNIARRFDIDSDELIETNSLETDSLKVGQKIRIKPDAEKKKIKTYEAILSQAHIDQHPEIERASDSGEIKDFGVQERLILFAKKMQDIPYRFGGNSFLGIDCSAYVKKVYSLIGIALPRSAREQFEEGIPVKEDELSIGDLVFFKTYASFPSHVGIYLGNNLFIHASSKSKKVTIDSLDTPYYFKRFIGAKRLIEAQERKDTASTEG
jgi:cell wall-associated NlpC family hydrolase